MRKQAGWDKQVSYPLKDKALTLNFSELTLLMKPIYLAILLIPFSLSLFAQTANTISAKQNLYNEIVKMDSLFFTAYNTCDIKTQAFIYSDSIEFYHDKGGLSTSKKDILEATQKNICGKVTRELMQGSVEVYAIKGYGAVEMGLHKFHNNQEPEANQPKEPSRFIIIWHQLKDKWEITRVISLH